MVRPRPRAAVAAALALVLLAGACSDDDGPTADGSDRSTTSPADGRDPGEGPNGFRPDPIEWDDCAGVDCGTLEVPLDYEDPDSRRIEISVVRRPADGERQGALFVNPGGPGGSATELATLLPILLPEAITESFDIIGVEPRGLPGSEVLACGNDYDEVYGVDPTVEDAADEAVLIATADQVATNCEAAAGELLPHVGTRDVAQDLDAVRAALGDAQLSYYGASYGTAIGQVYAELFPAHIAGMVLDGVVELGPTGLELAADQADGFELALQSFASHCRDEGCRTDDVVAAVEQVQALSERPGGIPAPDDDRPAGPGEVDRGISQALYSPMLWGQLDDALSDALEGDAGGILSLAADYLSAGSFDVYFAVNCLDFAWPTGDPAAFFAAGKEAGRAAPHFGEALVTDYLRCVHWPVPPEPLTAVTAPGSPPIIVISTTGDPATPYEAGVRVADRLEHGVLVTYEGEGHGALIDGGSCVNALVAAYLVNGAVPTDGARC